MFCYFKLYFSQNKNKFLKFFTLVVSPFDESLIFNSDYSRNVTNNKKTKMLVLMKKLHAQITPLIDFSYSYILEQRKKERKTA